MPLTLRSKNKKKIVLFIHIFFPPCAAEIKKQREFYQKLGMEVPGDIKGELCNMKTHLDQRNGTNAPLSLSDARAGCSSGGGFEPRCFWMRRTIVNKPIHREWSLLICTKQHRCLNESECVSAQLIFFFCLCTTAFSKPACLPMGWCKCVPRGLSCWQA